MKEIIQGIIFWGAIIVVVYLARRKNFKFKEDQIKEKWETLIDRGSGNAETVYEVINSFLESVKPPKVGWERSGIHVGDLFTGKQYDGLKVVDSYLRDYKIYIFAYDYGTSLHVAWFLTYQKDFFRFAKRMDIPQQLELGAYITTVHGATKSAVKSLMDKLDQDFSKVNTKSKGFLEVW
jgi:hypothetical protein